MNTFSIDYIHGGTFGVFGADGILVKDGFETYGTAALAADHLDAIADCAADSPGDDEGPQPDGDPSPDDGPGDSYPKCNHCEGDHPTYHCPEIDRLLKANPFWPAEDVNYLYRKDRATCVLLLSKLTGDELIVQAFACAAQLREETGMEARAGSLLHAWCEDISAGVTVREMVAA